MDFNTATNVLGKIKYKPDTKIELQEAWGAGILLVIEKKSQDANKPETWSFAEDSNITGKEYMPNELLRNMDEDTFIRWVFEAVYKLEQHEIYEFFRIDGKCYIDPHPSVKHGGSK